MAATVGGIFDDARQTALRERLRHPPEHPQPDVQTAARPATCWTLARIRATFSWLTGYSLSGLWRLLRRCRIRVRQGRPQQFSPDPEYLSKETRLLAVLRQAGQAPGRVVVLFVDEFTYYHWPLVARDWASQDGPPPVAHRAAPGERRQRVVAALDASSGQVHYRQASRIGGEQFLAFLQQLERAYPAAEHIYLVLDNWPVHHQPAVVAAVDALPRLELVYLPTYAPWLNPIEKLWDWVKEAELRLHRLAGQWKVLKQRVAAFLDGFADGSTELLQRVGLLGDGKLACALLHGSTDLDGQN